MYKKFISLITAFILTFSACPSVAQAKETQNPDLKALASSLGADTDCFNFRNYTAETVDNEIQVEFGRKQSLIDAYFHPQINPVVFAKALAGLCSGISTLEILAHNGIISPSDIQEGAESLHDIELDSSVNDIICYYQFMQTRIKQNFYLDYYHCNSSEEQKVRDIIEQGEKALETGKYFYIALNLKNSGHAMVGIGIADGSWTFNEKEYDKCILTLDSNSDVGFNEKCCIYINTQDNTYCVPAYEKASIRGIIADDTLLNYKGLINPCDNAETDVSDIMQLKINNSTYDYDLTIGSEDSEETYSMTPSLDSVFTDNDFYMTIPEKRVWYVKGDRIKFNVTGSSTDTFDANTICYLTLTTETGHYTAGYNGNFSAEIRPNYAEVTGNTLDFNLTLMEENGLYNSSPFREFGMVGNVFSDTPATVSMAERDDGILVKSDAPFCAEMFWTAPVLQENGTTSFNDNAVNKGMEILSVSDILMRYDENSDDIKVYIDRNNDNDFETEIQNGDTDCNGKLDASDASEILSNYAKISVTPDLPYFYINKFADYDNDGSVNAADASSVLAEYAKSATK